jgi:hypothetical protein
MERYQTGANDYPESQWYPVGVSPETGGWARIYVHGGYLILEVSAKNYEQLLATCSEVLASEMSDVSGS